MIKILKKIKHRISFKLFGDIGPNSKFINKSTKNHIKLDIKGSNNTLEIEENVILINCNFHIRDNYTKIKIEKNCILKNCIIWIEDDYSSIEIGAFTTMESGQIAALEGKSIQIGRDCMLANNIQIRTSDSHGIFDNENTRLNTAQNIKIEDHVWLCNNSIILKGVTIGTGSIIGTQSIVTKNIPSKVIAAGNPTKIIKTEINWSREKNE